MNNAIDHFIQYINQYVFVEDDVKQILYETCVVEAKKKNEILLKDGAVCHRLYFVKSGVIRSYYYQNGKEVTSWLYIENQLATSWYSYVGKTPSFEYLQVAEDAVLVSITYDQMEKLYETYPKLERFGRKVLESQIAFIDSFAKGYMFMSAKERYTMLLSFYPDLVHRVNLGYIASLLGISQETLSRIRAGKG